MGYKYITKSGSLAISKVHLQLILERVTKNVCFYRYMVNNKNIHICTEYATQD